MDPLSEFTLDMPGWVQAMLVLTLFSMMFAVALGLSGSGFRALAANRKAYIAGVIAQLVALPLLTLGLCYALSPPPSVALGMIVVACCPGGVSSNLVALFARANLELSVALTATSSLVAALLTPFSILLWSSLYAPAATLIESIGIDIVSFLVQTTLLLALPIALGMAVRAKAPEAALRWQGRIAAVSGLSLLGLILYGGFLYRAEFALLGVGIIGLVVMHNGLAFALGWALAKLASADRAAMRTVTIETGIQNTGLALVILVNQFVGLGGAVAVVGVWGTWHVFGGGLIALAWRWQDERLGRT
jgi:BASS family bile acid:Na+ symporter